MTEAQIARGVCRGIMRAAALLTLLAMLAVFLLFFAPAIRGVLDEQINGPQPHGGDPAARSRMLGN